MDEDGEAQRIAAWDTVAADAAFQAQRAQVLEAQAAMEAEVRPECLMSYTGTASLLWRVVAPMPAIRSSFALPFVGRS